MRPLFLTIHPVRILSSIALFLGIVTTAAGGFALYTTISMWKPLGLVASQMAINPQQWHGHWLGNAIFYLLVGLLFVVLGIGLWRRSRGALIAWCIAITALAAFESFLYIFHPLPFGFEQTDLPELTLLVVLSIASYVVLRLQRIYQKTSPLPSK